MLAMLLFCLGLLAISRIDAISPACLKCICQQESNCRPLDCRMDVGSLSCGYFQIKEPYWRDCRQPGGDWEACSKDFACASECVQNYMDHYVKHSGCPATCETYARIHNGGPQGCKKSSTLTYWQNLQRQPGCSNLDGVRRPDL